MNADGIKMTSYFGERRRANGTFVTNALVDLYGRNDIAASSCYAASRDSGWNTICASIGR